jgi:hypothetical protein
MAMPKLSKTQKELLQRAAANSYGRVSAESSVNTARRPGQMTSGTRAKDALGGLIKSGLVRLVSQDHDILYTRGWSTHVYSTTVEITEAGRAAI